LYFLIYLDGDESGRFTQVVYVRVSKEVIVHLSPGNLIILKILL